MIAFFFWDLIKLYFKNKYLKAQVEQVVKKVIAGTSISKAFAQVQIFPDVFQQLLSSGDLGSQVSEMFEKTKEFLDQEVDTLSLIHI